MKLQKQMRLVTWALAEFVSRFATRIILFNKSEVEVHVQTMAVTNVTIEKYGTIFRHSYFLLVHEFISSH